MSDWQNSGELSPWVRQILEMRGDEVGEWMAYNRTTLEALAGPDVSKKNLGPFCLAVTRTDMVWAAHTWPLHLRESAMLDFTDGDFLELALAAERAINVGKSYRMRPKGNWIEDVYGCMRARGVTSVTAKAFAELGLSLMVEAVTEGDGVAAIEKWCEVDEFAESIEEKRHAEYDLTVNAMLGVAKATIKTPAAIENVLEKILETAQEGGLTDWENERAELGLFLAWRKGEAEEIELWKKLYVESLARVSPPESIVEKVADVVEQLEAEKSPAPTDLVELVARVQKNYSEEQIRLNKKLARKKSLMKVPLALVETVREIASNLLRKKNSAEIEK